MPGMSSLRAGWRGARDAALDWLHAARSRSAAAPESRRAASRRRQSVLPGAELGAELCSSPPVASSRQRCVHSALKAPKAHD
jgi:hypothetical protein